MPSCRSELISAATVDRRPAATGRGTGGTGVDDDQHVHDGARAPLPPGGGYALGVDLGTTYLAAAVWRDGRSETVGLGDRSPAVPSAVLYEPDGATVVGEAAAALAVTAPDRVVLHAKRRFGDDVPLWVAGRSVHADAVISQLLRWVLATVCERQGGPPLRLAVTVPATWQEYRLDLMRRAAEDAVAAITGSQAPPTSLLPEPAAAAIHYAGRRPLRPGGLIGVYDLGGGTTDATVLRKTPGSFEIVGTPQGAEWLGGVDLDHALVRLVTERLAGGPQAAAWAALDRQDPAVGVGLAALRRSVVEAKEALSGASQAVVPVMLPGLTTQVPLTRAELEEAVRPTLESTLDVFAEAVTAAGLSVEELDAVLLVGGSSRIPLVRQLMTERTGVPVTLDAHPKFAVCLGAAVSAGAATMSTGAAVSPGAATMSTGAAPVRETGRVTPFTDRPITPATLPGVPGGPGDGTGGQPDVVGERIDLAASDLGGAGEVPLRPAVSRPRPGHRAARAAPGFGGELRVDLRQDPGYPVAGRRGAVVATLTVTAAVVAFVIVARLLGG